MLQALRPLGYCNSEGQSGRQIVWQAIACRAHLIGFHTHTHTCIHTHMHPYSYALCQGISFTIFW
uniref:Uncharacterized protein n=1 Tax=Octopus bimaculoides TaxID=37653 RepID=A0A0L8FPZ9_OCTBM